MDTNTKPALEWQAPVRVDHERSQKWYLVTGLICATFIGYGIFTKAWTLSITFATLGGLYYLTRNERHAPHSIRILDIGIEFDGLLRPWAEWKHFWILRGEGYHELHVTPQKNFRQEILIQTGEVDPYLIRDTIGLYLPQITHQKERLLDAIIRFCKL
jgi:hypothetical protein